MIENIRQLVAEAGAKPWDWQPADEDKELQDEVSDLCADLLHEAYAVQDKISRRERLAEIKSEAITTITAKHEERWSDRTIREAVGDLESSIVRGAIVAGEPRIDGRDTATVRDISVEVGVLPRAHGSALFTRGETQALVTATLGTDREAQIIDAIEGEYKEPFMLHYNFPPYCVGETGRSGSPKRREIGHGKLAKRALIDCHADPRRNFLIPYGSFLK